MKKATLICVLLALVAGALTGPSVAAKPSRKRVTRQAEATYALPYLGTASVPAGGCVHWAGVGNPCPEFPISGAERWVTMEVHDATGTPTAFEIAQVTADGLNVQTTTVGGPFCGSSGKEPVELTPGRRLLIRVLAAGDVVCPGGFGTSGTVTAVFSNVR